MSSSKKSARTRISTSHSCIVPAGSSSVTLEAVVQSLRQLNMRHRSIRRLQGGAIYIIFEQAEDCSRFCSKTRTFGVRRMKPRLKKLTGWPQVQREWLLQCSEGMPVHSGVAVNLRFRVMPPPRPIQPEQQTFFAVHVVNSGIKDRKLLGCYVVEPNSWWEVKGPSPDHPKSIHAGSSGSKHHAIRLIFQSHQLGRHRATIWFVFEHFLVPFRIEVTVSDEEMMQQMMQSQDGAKLGAYQIDTKKRRIIPAPPLGGEAQSKTHYHSLIETNYQRHLPKFSVPTKMIKAIEGGEFFPLDPWMHPKNYIELLHNLLHIEEAASLMYIRRYDLRGVEVERLVDPLKIGKDVYFDPFHRIQVPGLAENRPSLLRRDFVYLWEHETSDVEFQGLIVSVEKDAVVVRLANTFNDQFTSAARFNVRFQTQRISTRVQHRGVDSVNVKLLFPQQPTLTSNPLVPLQLFDKRIKNNKEQYESVQRAVSGIIPPLVPFLLHGAFGTGKTQCLVEMVLQLALRQKDNVVLVVAPSNSAADVITSQLARRLSPDQLFRLYAIYRGIGSVPRDLLAYANWNGRYQLFEPHDLSKLRSYRVIVTTVLSSGTLFAMGMGKHDFTHILCDEAAQLEEASLCVPLSMAGENTRVILAGDPLQLGPHFLSEQARRHNLDRSLMERLILTNTVMYGENGSHICKLRANYRTHPAVLSFASAEFYGSSLLPKASPPKFSLSLLPDPSFPVLFIGVEGHDLQENDSPSFFNPEEVQQVVLVVAHLFKENPALKAHDIGIISPYHKQVKKIRQMLNARSRGAIKVGTVAEFQGSERNIIIISTVRASKGAMSHDQQFALGMVKSEKHLNTAISRTASILVVIGDPYVLSTDPVWNRFIKFCGSNSTGQVASTEYLEKKELLEDIVGEGGGGGGGGGEEEDEDEEGKNRNQKSGAIYDAPAFEPKRGKGDASLNPRQKSGVIYNAPEFQPVSRRKPHDNLLSSASPVKKSVQASPALLFDSVGAIASVPTARPQAGIFPSFDETPANVPENDGGWKDPLQFTQMAVLKDPEGTSSVSVSYSAKPPMTKPQLLIIFSDIGLEIHIGLLFARIEAAPQNQGLRLIFNVRPLPLAGLSCDCPGRRAKIMVTFSDMIKFDINMLELCKSETRAIIRVPFRN